MQFPDYHPPSHEALDIVYDDEAIVIVNKPAGLLTTPGRGEHKQDCLLSRVREQFPLALDVHRLDMATSGLVIMALGKEMQRQVSILFQQRQVSKSYVAVVNGLLEEDSGGVDAPMITDWPNRPLQKIDYQSGKPALTHYQVLERNHDLAQTRIRLVPVTGRTHQLRLHMQSIGHPIIGDNLYGDAGTDPETAQRMLLHANVLEFNHPKTGMPMYFRRDAEF